MNRLHNGTESYGKLAKWLHWGMALMLVMLVSVGSYMTGLDKSDPSRFQLMGIHKSVGAIFMQLAIFRLIWSRISRAPLLPESLASWERLLSRLVTASLYFLMLAIPFSGFAMTNFAGYPVNIFGLIEMPQLFDKNPEMVGLARQAHGVLVYALLTAIFMHIAGGLKHRFLDTPEKDVLPRMTSLKPRV